MPSVNNASLHVSRSFGGIAKKLEAVPAQATAQQLKQILDNGWPTVARGQSLSKGESAWLQILAEHPNGSAALRKEIASKVAELSPSETAVAAHADIYFKDLLEQPAPQAGNIIGTDGKTETSPRAIQESQNIYLTRCKVFRAGYIFIYETAQ